MCDSVSIALRTVTGCQGQREREKDESDKMTAGRYLSLPLWTNRGHEPGVTVRKKRVQEKTQKEGFFRSMCVNSNKEISASNNVLL